MVSPSLPTRVAGLGFTSTCRFRVAERTHADLSLHGGRVALRQANWQRLCRKGKILRFHDGPFLIGNDWNMSTQDRGFRMARGNTSRSTCQFGGNMRSGFRQMERQHVIGEASKPHVPITVRVQERPRAHKLHALRKIKELRLNKFLQKARRPSHIFSCRPCERSILSL